MYKMKSNVFKIVWNKFLSCLFVLAFIQSNSSSAANHSSAQFALPTTLVKSLVKDQGDVKRLVENLTFQDELRKLAQQIDQSIEDDISLDHKLGLKSMLNQNSDVINLISDSYYPYQHYHYELYAKASQSRNESNKIAENISSIITNLLYKNINQSSDKDLHKISQPMGWSLELGRNYLLWLFNHLKLEKTLSQHQALQLVSNYQLYKVYESILPTAVPLLEAERNKRYEVKPNVLVKTPEGATISAIVVRKKGDRKKRPTAFQFSIYADEKWNTLEAMHAAAHGYVGVIAFTRGKAYSPDEIVPWEHDGKDATAIIDWISKQKWSDGRVVMYGGSYLGFTQWAAAKYMHPALKTIVPYAAAHPFTGLPIENNIFITPNYQWSFHVTNNKTMDHSVYENPQYWQDIYTKLFESGRAFNEIDKIEGTPNPWFQKLLKHPSYDDFYQQMLPYKEDFNKIRIPVLSITGYFDGASISAIDFLKRHYQFNTSAQHYLLTGPYTHGTAQGIPRTHYGDYKLDDAALRKDTKEITFQWFDHVLFGKPKPELIKNKINYQLLGSNSWQHVSSYNALNGKYKSFYLSPTKNNNHQFKLTENSTNGEGYVSLKVDLADRKTKRNQHSWSFLQDTLEPSNGLVFSTDPLQQETELAGEITGHFSISINKKDVDIGFKFYEITEEGNIYQLTRYISRASYAKDMGKRTLLVPYNKTSIPIINSRMMGKLIQKGSRLVLVLNVNKNPGAQVNMGSGKDVSTETIEDAGDPLIIKWHSDSKINIPLKG